MNYIIKLFLKLQNPKTRIIYNFFRFFYRLIRNFFNLFFEKKEDTLILPPAYCYQPPECDCGDFITIVDFDISPRFSIIMPVYNVSPHLLNLAIKSVERQWYPEWELCIVDDGSSNQATLSYLSTISNPKVKIKYLKRNLNISGASNEALKIATGDYIVLMDNDDELTVDALYEVAKAINATGAEFIYSDEDKIELDGTYCDPYFKPDFSPDLFLCQNYLSHLGVIKKTVVDKTGGFEVGLEGSQDYDLYLKALEHTEKIYHIPRVLYHWRKIPGSTAACYGEKNYASDAGLKALEHAMKRRNIFATVEKGLTLGTYKISYKIKNDPLVSIVIPFQSQPEVMESCIHSIFDMTTYKHYEIVCFYDSDNDRYCKTVNDLSDISDRLSFYKIDNESNSSTVINKAVLQWVNGDFLLFLNSNVKIISPSWIEEMLMHSQRDSVGVVGAKIRDLDNLVKNVGIAWVTSTINYLLFLYSGLSENSYFYFSRLHSISNYSSVSPECMMVKKQLFEELGGFDEDFLSYVYSGIDFCLRLFTLGKYNLYSPYVEICYNESGPSECETDTTSKERLAGQLFKLKEKHQNLFLKNDPFYSTNLSRYCGYELNPVQTTEYKNYLPQPFTEKIIKKEHFHEKSKKIVCLFSHFDKENKIKSDVIYYISELSNSADIVFITTAEGLDDIYIDKISTFCRDVIVKENYGYDFGAWKTGLEYVGEELHNYESLILCNDSVWGPLYDLEPIIDSVNTSSYDVYALSDSYEIDYHLQSFFVIYSRKAFLSTVFQDYWLNFKIYKDKQAIIDNNEIAFSTKIFQSDLEVGVYASSKGWTFLNPLHYYWKELITEKKFPFLKKELILRNPLSIDLSNWKKVIHKNCKYPLKFIK